MNTSAASYLMNAWYDPKWHINNHRLKQRRSSLALEQQPGSDSFTFSSSYLIDLPWLTVSTRKEMDAVIRKISWRHYTYFIAKQPRLPIVARLSTKCLLSQSQYQFMSWNIVKIRWLMYTYSSSSFPSYQLIDVNLSHFRKANIFRDSTTCVKVQIGPPTKERTHTNV